MNAARSFEVFRLHGGKVAAARSLFPEVRASWVDLSTGISPWAYPHDAIAAEAFTRLPDPEALAELEAAAGESFGVGSAARVIATLGSDIALRSIGRALVNALGNASANDRAHPSPRVAVVRPGYSGHMLMWDGMTVTSIAAADIESAARDHDVIVLANPNNPDGRIVPRDVLLGVAERLAVRAGVLIVDEAFADVRPEHSLCGALNDSRARSVMVLRSFGKFYGLAGVRLGFVVMARSGQGRAFEGAGGNDARSLAAAERLDKGARRGDSEQLAGSERSVGAERFTAVERSIRHSVGDWPVSGPAVALGTAAYRDHAWQSMQRQRLTTAAQRLDALLVGAGATIEGGTALFRLARCADADALFRHLAAHGVLTRPFSSDRTLLRVGLPGEESHWERLAAALDSRHIQ